MKLDQKTLIFVFVVLLILISIYYNIVRAKNNILLLVVVVSVFMYYKQFTNGRIEKFYKEQYKNYKNKDKQLDSFTSTSNYNTLLGAGISYDDFITSNQNSSITGNLFPNTDMNGGFNNMISSNLNNFLILNKNTKPALLDVNFGPNNSKNIKLVRIWAGDRSPKNVVSTMKIEGSNDNSSFTEIFNNMNSPFTNSSFPITENGNIPSDNIDKSIEIVLNNDTEYRYYRFSFFNNVDETAGVSGTHIKIGELALYEEQSMSTTETEPIEQNIQDVFNQIDTNNDGKIDFNEFKLFIQSEPNDLSDEDIRVAFNRYDTNNDNHINLEEFNLIMLIGDMGTVLDTQNTPTNQYLKRIFLNKSKFHNSSPSINILRSGGETITQPDDTTSGLRRTQLNFFNLDNTNNSNMNNLNNGNYQFNVDEILSSDTSLRDMFNFNYDRVDDLLDNVNKRNYDFNINPIDFNVSGVSTDPNSEETGSPNSNDNDDILNIDITNDPNTNPISSMTDINTNIGNSGKPKSISITDIVSNINPPEETAENTEYQFSPISYFSRSNDNSDNNNDNDNDNDNDSDENNDDKSNQDRETIYNTLFGDVQQDEQRDGISYYANRFFSGIQGLFD